MITKMQVTPFPLQRPHPPLWQVIDSPRSIQAAAADGVQGMFWLPPVSALKERFELYRDTASRASGREYALGEGIGLVRDVYVADTMEQARADFEESLMTTYRWIMHWRGLANLMEAGEELTDAHELSFDFLHGRNLLVGTRSTSRRRSPSCGTRWVSSICCCGPPTPVLSTARRCAAWSCSPRSHAGVHLMSARTA
ncbi:LLM class flavin-dependent oxidoreductase [Streptomyces sp. FXJ1.4098]|nr:LLM class flavin-dependent oxidoreductase [Streptomyces sp. FXJ1.4098]